MGGYSLDLPRIKKASVGVLKTASPFNIDHLVPEKKMKTFKNYI